MVAVGDEEGDMMEETFGIQKEVTIGQEDGLDGGSRYLIRFFWRALHPISTAILDQGA
jgi:hypothetical protein